MNTALFPGKLKHSHVRKNLLLLRLREFFNKGLLMWVSLFLLALYPFLSYNP